MHTPTQTDGRTTAGTQDRANAHAEGTASGRADLYAGIHKALRLFMTRTLTTVGATDPADGDEVRAALAQLERLLALCELHIHDEDTFVHPALERARPGSAARIAAEHTHHGEGIADLRDLAALVADTQGTVRASALFVADNFQHMHVEETTHNAVLWAHYTDAELLAIEQAIVASIPPDAMMQALHWFLPALNASERAAMLAQMQQGMPPEPFRAVLEIAERTLDTPQLVRLRRALGLPAVPGLATA